MLSKQLKLNLRKDKDFFSTCKRKHSPYFSFFYKKNDNAGLKIAVIVPKKIVKLATKRNEVKRKIYSSIEGIKINEKNIDLVIVANKKSISETREKLVKIIERSLVEITK